jgi:polyisoprenoid-binding protein YceI
MLTRLTAAAALASAFAIAGAITLAPSADARAAANAAASTYKPDVVHSSIIFRIRHAGVANFYGRFNEFEGSFTWDDASPENSDFEFTIKLDSVDTGNEGRDNHLRNPDFFNVRQFPTARFKSTSVTPRGDSNFEVAGELTLHGVTKAITANLEHTGSGRFRNNEVMGFEATFDIKRSDFGIMYGLAPDQGEGGGIGNTVRLIFAVEGVKQ